MRPVDFVQHDVNRHARDGDVEPDGIRPARDSAVTFEPSLSPAVSARRINGTTAAASRVCEKSVKPKKDPIKYDLAMFCLALPA